MVNGKSWKSVPGAGLSGQKQNFSWAAHKASFSSAHRSLSEAHRGNRALETLEIQSLKNIDSNIKITKKITKYMKY